MNPALMAVSFDMGNNIQKDTVEVPTTESINRIKSDMEDLRKENEKIRSRMNREGIYFY